jgi:hypothetical protein
LIRIPDRLLEASTRYWIHFTVDSGYGAYALNNTQSQVSEPGWTLENTSTYTYAQSNWNELHSGPQARVRMTVVPETTSPLLGSIGARLFFRRRR